MFKKWTMSWQILRCATRGSVLPVLHTVFFGLYSILICIFTPLTIWYIFTKMERDPLSAVLASGVLVIMVLLILLHIQRDVKEYNRKSRNGKAHLHQYEYLKTASVETLEAEITALQRWQDQEEAGYEIHLREWLLGRHC